MTVAATRRQVEAFKRACRTVPYEAKGIFYSELFLFLQSCRGEQINLLIESGVLRGVSTRVIAEQTGRVPLISIDRNKSIDPPAGSEFIEGDALAVIPMLIERYADRRIGMILDGPKGETARALKDAALAHEAVRVVAIHDEPIGAGETMHSHDPDFREKFGREIDALIEHPYAEKYPDGPGLAVWVKA